MDRKLAPPVNEIKSFTIVPSVHTEMPNGIHLHVINSGEGDLIKLEWMFAVVIGINLLHWLLLL
jgi:hypothetical protein